MGMEIAKSRTQVPTLSIAITTIVILIPQSTTACVQYEFGGLCIHTHD